jgi:hypothetical protein
VTSSDLRFTKSAWDRGLDAMLSPIAAGGWIEIYDGPRDLAQESKLLVRVPIRGSFSRSDGGSTRLDALDEIEAEATGMPRWFRAVDEHEVPVLSGTCGPPGSDATMIFRPKGLFEGTPFSVPALIVRAPEA